MCSGHPGFVSVQTLVVPDMAGIISRSTTAKMLFVMPVFPIDLSKWPVPLGHQTVLKIGATVLAALQDCWQNGIPLGLCQCFFRFPSNVDH